MKRKAIYTQMEIELNAEASTNKGRLLSALWIKGKGPRGGKVNIGQVRYDALNMLVIEHKAEVVSRFVGTAHYADLQVTGIVIRYPKIQYPKVKPRADADGNCIVCGLLFEEPHEPNETPEPHVCPPGFTSARLERVQTSAQPKGPLPWEDE